jgi:hypothetical protein
MGVLTKRHRPVTAIGSSEPRFSPSENFSAARRTNSRKDSGDGGATQSAKRRRSHRSRQHAGPATRNFRVQSLFRWLPGHPRASAGSISVGMPICVGGNLAASFGRSCFGPIRHLLPRSFSSARGSTEASSQFMIPSLPRLPEVRRHPLAGHVAADGKIQLARRNAGDASD